MKFPKPLNYATPPPDSTWEFLTSIEWFESSLIEEKKEEAISEVLSSEWEDFTLERANEITESLATNHRGKETEWNKVVVAYREYFKEQIKPKVLEAIERKELASELVDDVAWNVLSFMMETTYESWRVPRFFYKVVDSYKQGKLPCGWIGNYPDGTLKEY